MNKTVYSKYSNERAREFCIRTDIIIEESNEKKVYKHALYPEGKAHVAKICEHYQKLEEIYAGTKIHFCPCEQVADAVAFEFLRGVTLQERLERAVERGNELAIERILRNYISRMQKSGSVEPFVVTPEFENVFGKWQGNADTQESLKITNVDMILSNIFLEEEDDWCVIDYEWTFDFPIPKDFLIYRALYFAYYQVLHDSGWSLNRCLELADITEEQAGWYKQMEECFQAYLSNDAFPVRNMQRLMGTEIKSIEDLLTGECDRNEAIKKKVRKIYYHIDRDEYQDGCQICSGWALAITWSGKHLPVEIKVKNQTLEEVFAEVTRRERADVTDALKIKKREDSPWGFDCVWIAPRNEKWTVCFSLGKKESIYEVG